MKLSSGAMDSDRRSYLFVLFLQKSFNFICFKSICVTAFNCETQITYRQTKEEEEEEDGIPQEDKDESRRKKNRITTKHSSFKSQ